MPMMLEEHINALGGGIPAMDDDLFGDEVLPMASGSPSKQLQQRLDDMRSRGCCRTIAFSKHGIIASVTPDGSSVNLQCPRTRPKDGSWELTEPKQCSMMPPPLHGGPIVHLAWAPTPTPELAVIDAFGRICLLSFPVYLNKAAIIRKWDTDVQDDLHSVVGCYWLPTVTRSINVTCAPAVKENDKYQFINNISQNFGPWHPNPQKSALVCVTASGLLKLLFSQNNNQLQEIHLEMESVASSDDLITHAAICSERGKLLIVLATISKQLKVVIAEINWGVSQPQDKQVPPGSLPLRPTLKIDHVHTANLLQQDSVDSPLDSSMDLLSFLEVLPPILDIRTKSMTPAMILAGRSHLPSPQLHYNLDHQSIIDRWDIALDQAQQLHPAFEQRGTKGGPTSALGNIAALRKRESTVLNKIIVSVDTTLNGKIICFGMSDGTVQYRDRMAMTEISQEENEKQIMIMQQAGFHFVEEKPSLQISFSANNCSYVQLCENGKVRWNTLQYPMAQITESSTDPRYEAVLTSIIMGFVNAGHQTNNFDDVLAVARPFAEKYPRFLHELLTKVVFMLNTNVDYTDASSQDQLPRNVQLHYVMSILNHFGFRGDFKPRTFGGKFISLSMSLRNIYILLVMASSALNDRMREKINPLDDPEAVIVLSSSMKWVIDLMSWMTDGLFLLRDDPQFTALLEDPRTFVEMTDYLKTKHNVSLHLLLCSSTRWLLAAVIRRFPWLQSVCQRAQQMLDNKPAGSTPDTPITANQSLHRAYARLQYCITTDLIKIEEFEKLLNFVTDQVRETYKASLAGLQQNKPQQPVQQKPGQPSPAEQAVKKAQAHCELSILLADQPPQSFQNLVKRLFESDLGSIMGSTDRSNLFFTDFPLLEVHDKDSILAKRKREGKYVDVFRRIEHRAPQLGMHSTGEASTGSAEHPGFRRCTRCCGVMEELQTGRPGFNILVSLQRKCACAGSWAALP
ncbi:RNA polymerase II mediator complex subunit Sin4 [Coniella lustricola]|uniref:Mediator of RNA polymerase II transcription subunit 16 n=1 Tax=Coniella lustricola TaxID=2025994 RepID=A0A2T3AIX7_9PEZI|nr:RNA polymerase II mediator complex subunit Sin4 [Coniella lustricola]